jgi:hypothetical protein
MKLLRRHIVLANLGLLLLVLIFAIVIWRSGQWFLAGSVETFGPLHNYSFIWLSIAIASVAALNSIFAATITSDTHRPFLFRTPDVDVEQVNSQVTCPHKGYHLLS